MNNRKTFWLGIVAAAALAAAGCSDSDGTAGSGGSAGSGGTAGGGGTGGMETAMGSITAVHLAPEVPAAGATDVTIYVNGTAATSVAYGESTGRVDLPAGEEYAIGLGTPDDEIITLDPITLEENADLVAVAYRVNGAEPLPVGVFLYDISTEGLADDAVRLFVSHGADDSALKPVDIINTDACPEPLLDQFAFGETAPGEGEDSLDLPAADYNLGFDLDPGDCDAEVPFAAALAGAGGLSVIVVAVDEAVTDTSEDELALDPEAWAIIDASDSPVRLIGGE